MFVKLLVPYKNYGVGSVLKSDALPQDVLKDLAFAGGVRILAEPKYQTRMMTAEKVSKKSKKHEAEKDSE